MGSIYLKTYDVVSNLKYNKLASECFKSAKMPYHHLFARINEAMTECEITNYKRSVEILDSIYPLCLELNDSSLIDYCIAAYLKPLVRMEQYDCVKEKFDMLNNYIDINDWDIWYYKVMVLLNIHNKDFEAAAENLQRAQGAVHNKASKYTLISIQCAFEKALHNYKEALELSDSLIKYQNDEVRIALRQELNSLHRDYYQAQAQIEKARKDIANQRLIIISVSIVILVIMLIWYIRMRRKRYVQKINAHIVAITKLERELQASSSNNATLSEKLHDLLATQFDTLNMVCSNYYDAQQIDERLRIGVYNRIKSELRVISSAASMANIASMVNSCLDNIVDDLKRFYPDISPEDTNLIVLFWAGLSVKSISFLTGVNSNTIYSKRRRWKARFQQLPEPYNGKFVDALQ